jgi:dTDP-4-dehydrorhamnose reductase
MRLLVTGAGGQLGRAIERLRISGVEILSRTHAEIDITDAAGVARNIDEARPDAIVNAAGYTNVRLAETEHEAAFRVNGTGAGLLAGAALSAGIPLVHISTDFVFDGAASRPYRPGDATVPINVYGASKLAGERAVLDRNPDGLVVRTSWLYSLGGRNFVTAIVAQLRQPGRAAVVTDEHGSPTSAAGLAALLVQAAQRKAAGENISGIRHFADEGVTSRYDFACAIRDEAAAAGFVDPSASVVLVAQSADVAVRRPAYSALDSSDIRTELGFPATPWREALRRAFREDRGLVPF